MRAAVDEMGLRLLGVGVVLEVAAATRQDERAQERQLRRVGAEERGHRRAQESLRGRRRDVQRRSEPSAERARIERLCARRVPRRVERQPLRHALEPLEGDAERSEREQIQLRNHAVVALRPPVELQDRVALVILGIGLETDFLAEREHPVLPQPEPGSPDRDHEPVGQGLVPDPTAYPVTRLEDDHAAPGLHQAPRGRQTGKAGTDDAYVGLARFHGRSPLPRFECDVHSCNDRGWWPPRSGQRSQRAVRRRRTATALPFLSPRGR